MQHVVPRRHQRARANLVLASLAVSIALSGPAAAEDAAFHCGREDHDRVTEPSQVWFELFHIRLGLALDLRRNGNDDLAARFHQCAMLALQRAAELGHVEAQYQFGLRLALREPKTEASRAEAYAWIKRAADRGHKRAKAMIDTW